MDENIKPQRAMNVLFNTLREKNYLTKYNVTYELSEVGLSIWELCDGNYSLEDIANSLTKEYDISFDLALIDTKEFIDELKVKSMLQ